MARLEHEQDNLRAALEWSLARDEDAGRAIRLAVALGTILYSRSREMEMREILGTVLSRPGGDPVARITVTSLAATAESCAGDFRKAQALREEALALARETGNRRRIVGALASMSMVPSDLGERDVARALQEEALGLAREIGDKWLIAEILHHLTMTAYMQGDDVAARALAEERVALYRDLGAPTGATAAHIMLGHVILAGGDVARARALAEVNLAQIGGFRNKYVAALGLRLLGDIARAEGDHASAESSYRDALAACKAMAGQRLWTTSYVISFAGIWVAQERTREAVRLYGAVHGWLESVGMPVPWAPPRGYERDEAAAREALGEEEFTRAWTEGQAMTLEQAVEYALREIA
jgi:ATP/maltotriose-dependent transcriptional regulator MalT